MTFNPEEITFVYLIAQVDGEGFKAPIKVGVAARPHGRVKDLSTACPFKIDVMETFAMSCRVTAMRAEQIFHKQLKNYRMNGEWFDVCPYVAFRILYNGLKADIVEYGKISEEEAENVMAMATESPSRDYYVEQHHMEMGA